MAKPIRTRPFTFCLEKMVNAGHIGCDWERADGFFIGAKGYGLAVEASKKLCGIYRITNGKRWWMC